MRQVCCRTHDSTAWHERLGRSKGGAIDFFSLHRLSRRKCSCAKYVVVSPRLSSKCLVGGFTRTRWIYPKNVVSPRSSRKWSARGPRWIYPKDLPEKRCFSQIVQEVECAKYVVASGMPDSDAQKAELMSGDIEQDARLQLRCAERVRSLCEILDAGPVATFSGAGMGRAEALVAHYRRYCLSLYTCMYAPVGAPETNNFSPLKIVFDRVVRRSQPVQSCPC